MNRYTWYNEVFFASDIVQCTNFFQIRIDGINPIHLVTLFFHLFVKIDYLKVLLIVGEMNWQHCNYLKNKVDSKVCEEKVGNLWAQSSLSIFAQKYLRKYKETYFILQYKYLCIYKDSFGAKILPDDCNLIMIGFFVKTLYSSSNYLYVMQFFPTIYNFLVIKGNFWVLRCICIPSSCTIS